MHNAKVLVNLLPIIQHYFQDQVLLAQTTSVHSQNLEYVYLNGHFPNIFEGFEAVSNVILGPRDMSILGRVKMDRIP